MRTSLAYIMAVAMSLTLLLVPEAQPMTAPGGSSVFRISGDGMIMIEDTHTGETLSIVYRDADGRYDDAALAAIDRVLRCHGDQEQVSISQKLVELVDRVQDHFGVDIVRVVSGYRSAEYNAALKRRLRRVAHDSLHMQGMAMDINLPGVSKRELASYLRSLRAGGVGDYASSNFVHADVGPVRSW